MGLIVMEPMLVDSLDATLADLAAGGALLKLFKSNWTPAIGDDTTSFTEANFSGYAAQTIGAWNAATFSSNKARATATGNPFVFTNSTGVVNNDIYGYAVTDSTGAILLFAERGAAPPYDLNGAGKSLSINLRYTRGDDTIPD